MNWIQVASHLAAYVAGALTLGPVLAEWVRRRMTKDDEAPRARRTAREVFSHPLHGSALLTIAVAAAIVIALGIQQRSYNQEQEAHDQCVQEWGQQVIETLDVRVRANTQLTTAERDFFKAATNLLTVVSAIATEPPEAKQVDLTGARVAYGVAFDRYAQAQERVVTQREKNPYPTLNCR